MTDKKDLTPIIQSVVDGDRDKFVSSFDDSIKNRISQKLAVKHYETSKNILDKENKPTEENFVSKLDFLESENQKEIKLNDGNVIIINEKEANNLLRLYKSLNNNNQESMSNDIFKSKDNYERILELSKENNHVN